jgi:hypothetical protein
MSNRTLVGLVAAIGLALLGNSASAATVFGSKFTHQLTPPEKCNNAGTALCTWVLSQAQGFAGHEKAPHAGTIVQVRIVACAPGGTFVLQIVRTSGTNQAKAVKSATLINYKGTANNCETDTNFNIEAFNVNIPVATGDSIAVVASRVPFMYNSSSGPSILFNPPLSDAGTPVFRNSTSKSGFLMLQAIMNP